MLYTLDTTSPIDWGATGTNLILQNVANIIRTFKYEVGYLRTMGIPTDYIDKPLSKIKGKLATAIVEQVAKYEPNAKIKSVDIISVTADGNLQIKVVVEI